MVNEAPLPCPFCGDPPIVLPYDLSKCEIEPMSYATVVCANHDCVNPRLHLTATEWSVEICERLKKRAITKWNQRHG